MNKMLLAGAVLLAFASGPVTAADMGQPAAPAPVYTKAPMMPVYSWTGGYIGINGGYSWGDSEVATTTLSPPLAYFAFSSPPAIAAAVFNATGVFVNEIPITPERLMAAIEKTRAGHNR